MKRIVDVVLDETFIESNSFNFSNVFKQTDNKRPTLMLIDANMNA